MTLLLDTHIFLWAVMEPHKLPSHLRGPLENAETTVVVSAVCAWEIATKFRLGKLSGAVSIVADYSAAVRGLGAEHLAVNALHAIKAGSWDVAHRDPFDRMLAAQAAIERMPLATTNVAIRQFNVDLA